MGRWGRKMHADYPEMKERITAAFKAVRKHGILARQHFSCCGSCAGYELACKMDEAREAGRPKRGAVYYHRQATEGFYSRGEVYLGFGCDANAPEVERASDTEEDERTRLVGCFTVEALAEAGLDVEWDCTAGRCILVKGLKGEAA